MLLPTIFSVSAMTRLGSQFISRVRRVVDGNSLQTRLTIGVVLTSLLGIGTMALWMGWRMQQILMQEQKQRTALVADRLQEDARYYATMMPPAEALQRVIDYRTTSDVAIWVEAETGQMVMQSETLKMGSWQKSGVTDELLVASLQPGLQLVPIEGWQLVVCARPLEVPGMPPATAYVATDITAASQSFGNLVRLLLLTSLIMVGLLAIAFAVYIRQTLSPIRNLNRLASEVTADTLTDHQLSLAHAPTEVAELARSYNLMLHRLSQAWQQQKQFVNDMSHELRTPLTLVRGYLESTLRRGHNLTPAQRQGLETAFAETNRTVKLLQELLDLARLNHGNLPIHLAPTELRGVVQTAMQRAEADHSPTADAPSRFQLAVVGNPMAQIDRHRLSLVLAELFDNALRYSPPQPPIRVAVATAGAWATIAIHDYGPGIPPDCQEAIFNPFYRIDENRSRRTGGTGLGLTLVKSLTEAMHGQVTVESYPGQGSVFTLRLPTQEIRP
jgi:signal transduction histidine kinase